jgi:hypothetical protein
MIRLASIASRAPAVGGMCTLESIQNPRNAR